MRAGVVLAGNGRTCVYARVLVPATVHPGTPESAMHHPNEPAIACRSVLRIYNPPDAGGLLMSLDRARDICLYARDHGYRGGGGGSRVSCPAALLFSLEQVGTPTTNFSHVRLPESHSDVNRWVKRYFEPV